MEKYQLPKLPYAYDALEPIMMNRQCGCTMMSIIRPMWTG